MRGLFDRLGDLRRGGGLFTPLERPPPFDEAEEDELEDDERDPSEDDEELDEEPLRLRADEPEPDDEEVVDELRFFVRSRPFRSSSLESAEPARVFLSTVISREVTFMRHF